MQTDNVLTIDCGNTSTKVAVWHGMDMIDSIVSSSSETIAAKALEHNVKRAIMCTVSDEIVGLDRCLADVGCSLTRLRHDTPVPITIDYSTPKTLGLDRIAAAVGARYIFPDTELLVVDIGTAATYDRVTADGHFLGGNIAPGIGMRLTALHSFTAALPRVESRGETPLWGHSTVTAMRAGAVNGVAAEITWYRSRMPQGAVVVLTGGWASGMAPRLDFDTHQCHMLVNQGLNCILHYNETI